MKLFKKILKWTGITILTIVVIFVIIVFSLQNKKFDAPFPNLHATKDSAIIARGKYLAFGPAHCSGCHTPTEDHEKINMGEELPLKGGLNFDLPIGTLYSKNITPDDETGIGKLPDSVIARSLRYGVARDGRALFDFMPFHNLSDEDLVAVLSFLRSQAPVKNKVTDNQLNFIGKAVKAFLIKPVGPDGEVVKTITPDDETGIGKLPDSVIARSLRYGVARDGRALFDFMPFHNLSDEDLVAVLSFLRSQTPVKNKVTDNQLNFIGKAVKAFLIKPVGPDGEVVKTITPDTTATYGKYLSHYVTNCRGCHTNRSLMTGEYTGPFFAGGLKLEADDGSYCITPNLTPDKETGKITGWTEQQFIDRFRLKKIIAKSDMPWDQFRKMSDNDLKAIYQYLVSLEPIKNATGPTYVAAASTKK